MGSPLKVECPKECRPPDGLDLLLTVSDIIIENIRLVDIYSLFPKLFVLINPCKVLSYCVPFR